VRVLLDANLPRALVRRLSGHEAESIHARGWSDLDDRALLDACARHFDALVTLDQSLRFQQNLRGRAVAVVLLRARSNRIQDLEPLVPALLAALAASPPRRLAAGWAGHRRGCLTRRCS
jgi:predicted nuclease of predicted toxin-antitoxin system